MFQTDISPKLNWRNDEGGRKVEMVIAQFLSDILDSQYSCPLEHDPDEFPVDFDRAKVYQ